MGASPACVPLADPGHELTSDVRTRLVWPCPLAAPSRSPAASVQDWSVLGGSLTPPGHADHRKVASGIWNQSGEALQQRGGGPVENFSRF